MGGESLMTKPVTITLSKSGSIANIDFIQWIMNEIEDRAFKRQHVADTYAILLQKGATREQFVAINEAIIKRWSPSALRWIKERAWKRASYWLGANG